MKLFRQLSTRRLVALIAGVVVAALAAGIATMAALGSSAQTPPPKPLDQALLSAVNSSTPDGISARVRFTNNLFPSGSLAGLSGGAASALTSGASGRLWWDPDLGGRIELQSQGGDAQILWDKRQLTVWDSSSNTVYKSSLPGAATNASDGQAQPPTLADIDSFLNGVREQATLGDAVPSEIAGEPAYRLEVSPAHSAGLLGSLRLAWDAAKGVPLDVGVVAAGASSPVLELKVTEITFAGVSPADLSVKPPAGAKVVEIGAGDSKDGSGPSDPKVTGLGAVQAALPFTVVAPETLVGLPRQSVQLIGGKDEAAVVLYGHGLGGIALLERAAGTGGQARPALPKVSLGATTGHELATQLGTLLFFDRSGVAFVLAGSLPPAAAEAAARAL